MKRLRMSLTSDNMFSLGVKLLLLSLTTILFVTGCGDDDDVTNPNEAPPVPSDPVPADEATFQDAGIRLEWLCLDPDNDALTYYVYLGTSENPPLVDSVYTYLYNHARLEYNTTYYWRIEANDGNGHTVSSETWSFTTGNLYYVDDYDTDNALRMNLSDDNLIYLADDNSGLRIFDVTDTAGAGVRLDSVGAKLGDLSYNYDVCVANGWAYNATGNAMSLYNVSVPAEPTKTFTLEADIESRAVGIAGEYVVLAGISDNDASTVDSSGIYVVNKADTSNLTVETTLMYEGGSVRDMYIDGNYAYLADSLLGVIVVDISNPLSPSLVTTITTSGTPNGIFVYDNLAYVADGDAGLTILNVSTPSSPSLVSNTDTPGFSLDVCALYDPTSQTTHAFIADYWNGGLQIINVTDPSNPEIVSSRETRGGAAGIMAGIRTIDIDLDGTDDDIIMVYLGDKHLGLHVFQFQP